MRRFHPCGGFTLIEILIAFTILAVSLTVLLQAFSFGLRGLGAAEASATAVMHARSKLDELGTSIPLDVGQQEGEFADGFRWTAVVRPYRPDAGVDPSLDPNLPAIPYEVDVTVFWDQGKSVTLKTLRLGARP